MNYTEKVGLIFILLAVSYGPIGSSTPVFVVFAIGAALFFFGGVLRNE